MMFYLGIDQHARQITISLRDENGDVLLACQVSTQPDKIKAFFQKLTRERLGNGDIFVAVLEVCGFNDWLIGMLHDYHCHKVILIQPEERKKCKTDRRDAAALSELLWVNRDRLLQGKPVRGLRQVGIAWLRQVALPTIDRLEMNHLLADLEQIQERRKELEQVIAERCGVSDEAVLLSSMPGVSYFTAVSLACRVGRVERFPRAPSLANYWGLTPGCRNSGEKTQRLGSITKAGSSMARWLLAQVTINVLRRDARLREWFKRLKRRRGASIARVAVMRKLATVIWHMLSKRSSYAQCRALAEAGSNEREQPHGAEAGR